jgi:hypothetical protein
MQALAHWILDTPAVSDVNDETPGSGSEPFTSVTARAPAAVSPIDAEVTLGEHDCASSDSSEHCAQVDRPVGGPHPCWWCALLVSSIHGRFGVEQRAEHSDERGRHRWCHCTADRTLGPPAAWATQSVQLVDPRPAAWAAAVHWSDLVASRTGGESQEKRVKP